MLLNLGIAALHGKTNASSGPKYTINAYYSNQAAKICASIGNSITLYSAEVSTVAAAAAGGKYLYTNSGLTTDASSGFFYSDSLPGSSWEYAGAGSWYDENTCG